MAETASILPPPYKGLNSTHENHKNVFAGVMYGGKRVLAIWPLAGCGNEMALSVSSGSHSGDIPFSRSKTLFAGVATLKSRVRFSSLGPAIAIFPIF